MAPEYGLAAVSYIWTGVIAWRILPARSFHVVDAADKWWPSHRLADTTYVREQMLDYIASAARENRTRLEEKGKPLNLLLVAAAVETVFVAAAVIASLA